MFWLEPGPLNATTTNIVYLCRPLIKYVRIIAGTSPLFHSLSSSPLPASPYFAQALQIAVPASHLDMRAYYTPPHPRTPTEPGSVLVCHHGAGFSGLSFACFAAEVARESRGELGVFGVDARRHGALVLFVV